ncbi:DUF3135 domain-containing protein [uncultured Methylophaga sp.]|uniref:DUF3135 domain-containing protein n=1 Tax=uncultured Methylophaga sp. TaxID=285271 RepID=UPI00260F654B|nr:DUF3135 domain-containing protein [uncultured Methylophaga sp.]
MIINFEEWALLASQDRAAFEEKRAAAISQCIADIAHDDAACRRLTGLQFRVDMLRRKHKTPLGACIALSQMMMDEVHKLSLLDLDLSQQQTASYSSSCKILPFNKLAKDN